MAVNIVLSINGPEENEEIQGPPLTISGTAMAVSINTNNQQVSIFSVSLTISVTGKASVTKSVQGSWSETFNIDTAGRKTIKVVANYHPLLPKSVERDVTIVVEKVPPVLTITAPGEGARIDGPGPTFSVPLQVTATDPSGVQAVEYAIDNSSNYKPVSRGTNDNWKHDITGLSLGTHTINVRAKDKYNNTSTKSRTITFFDSGRPEINITSPETSPHLITWSEGGVSIELAGTASDSMAVQRVEWRLNGGAWQNATYVPGPSLNWRFTVVIPAPGLHDVDVYATDEAGNSNTAAMQLDVAVPFELADVGFAAYLEDLMWFTGQRVRTATTADSVDKSQLTENFCQPFDLLTGISFQSVTGTPVAQVRIAVEVLRRFLNNYARFRDYCETAYRSLLTNFGTSYTELRLARSADPETRQALANRLGIAMEGLEKLFLTPEQMTEARLQRVFGLIDTTQDPLTPVIDQAEILAMQLSKLRSSWLAQDQLNYSNPDIPAPIIDPDIIDKVDLKSAVSGNVAFDLFRDRRKWVTDQLEMIRQARKSQNTPLGGFDHAVNFGLSNNDGNIERIPQLLALEQSYKDGVDIEPDLRAIPLELDAFLVLMRLRKLADTGLVLDIEWEEFDNILVQVKKQREFKEWTRTEISANLTLEPNFFSPRSTLPELIPWRSTWRARRNWENKLDAHIRQREALIQAHRAAIEATEKAVLPLLRDALIQKINRQGFPDLDIADWLTQRLSISFKYSGDQKLSRLEQGIETLQDILLALRTGRLASLTTLPVGTPMPQWDLAVDGNYDEYDFDKEWEWMGSYATWRGAMFAFGYPENYLLPTLREKTTKAFRTLVNAIRQARRLTPNETEALAAKYLETLKLPVDQGGDSITYNIELSSQLTKKQLRERLNRSRSELEPYVDPVRGGLKPDTPPHLQEVYFFVPMLLALSLQKKGNFLAALDWYQTVYAYELPPPERKIYYGLQAEETIPTEFRRTLSWLLDGLDVFAIANDRANVLTRFTLISIVRCYLAFADAEFTRETNESIPLARRLYMTAQEFLGLLNGMPGVEHNIFPPNPVVNALRLHAELNLLKLHGGRNIAGMERIRTTPPAVELVATGGVLAPPPAPLKPTAYRYSALIERAKHLVTIAQQIEANFFAALEKRDAEAYNLLKAKQHVELAKEMIELQDLRIQEVDSGIVLMELQQDRAQIQHDTYNAWINAGPNWYERDMLKNYEDLNDKRSWLANLDFQTTAANALVAAATASTPPAASAAMAAVASVGVFAARRADATKEINSLEAEAQKNAFNANLKRRTEEWALQRALADQDIDIAAQQISQARLHKKIVEQERAIAGIQANHAEAEVEFLNNKFTNVELYEWMSGILSEVYSYFLQQATAMAQLALNQLAFERQSRPPTFIRSDYWQAPDDGTSQSEDDNAPDRRGLTGSVRLLQDIYQLDQYAFETNQRKLQLVEHFSLARLVPFELQRFRETGVLPFATPMALFDRGFPGHYLRLIKRVRLSIIGLIPPTDGIRASLSAAGVSRVVTGNEVYQVAEVRRPAEMIAFTSPTNATGLFELQPENELLLPFETMGVDANWELQAPKAANRFNFDTIADVIFTVEYTALHSPDYRHQVIQSLDRTFSAERAYSFKQDFPDLWYELHQPEGLLDEASGDIRALFPIERTYFPPNLQELRIDHVVLYFVRAEGADFELNVKDLQFDQVPSGNEPRGATSIDGVISTRRANAASWLTLLGASPVGNWTVVFADTPEFRNRFADNQIADILFVLSYSADTPPWPE